MRGATAWLEMIPLIVMLIIASTTTSFLVVQTSKPIISYTNEKSANDTLDEILEPEGVRYGKDLLLSLINTDEHAPYPNAIRIDNSPALKLDSVYQTTKYADLARVYNTSGDFQLGAKLDQPILATVFEEYTGLDGITIDVLHYYITTNPPT